MKRVGVLSFQGGVLEHLSQIKSLGHEAIQIKKEEDLKNLDAIILPGGESTAMGKLLDVTELKEPLKEKIKSGIPTWGTCAGMILLAKEIENDTRRHLSLMDIKVRRNAFGTQIDSFKVKVLCEVNDNIVAVRQDNMIATSFHPELTDDLTFLKYFFSI